MREDRIMELSTRGRRESDGEGVRTREENWEGDWVMGLKGAKGAERMKVKKERQQAKSAPMNQAACRFMGCSGYHYTSTRVDGETQLKWHLWGCVYLRMCCGTLSFSLYLQLVSSKTNWLLSWTETSRLQWGGVYQSSAFPPSTYLVLLVRRRDVWTTQDLVLKALLWCGKGIHSVHGYNHIKSSHQAQFYCLLWGIITPCHWIGGMLKKTKMENERKAATYCARQSETETLEPYGHPEGGLTCPV